MVFAKAGEQVFSVDGALYATVSRDLQMGKPVQCGDFVFVSDIPKANRPVPSEIIKWAKDRGALVTIG